MTAPIVEVKQGKLQGVISDNIDGGKYFSFRGIPFAEPPVGLLRFKDPQPPKPWDGIRDASEESKVSAQIDVSGDIKEGGDDCLYLNIATNSLTGKRPVIFWIHGGAFKRSSNTYKKYSPDYLLKKDIVFVSTNYRLSVLGFLNMEVEGCTGNQGLKDQIASLKWVQENIEAFGGDPNNVTIQGESAGGASVHALCLSPQARGLFHKAIIQSGVISNPWSFIPSNKEYGYSLAKILGKECSSPQEVTDFLRTIPALELIEKYENLHKKENVDLVLTQIPTSDTKSTNPVLPEPVSQMKYNGVKVPLLIGYNSHEGILTFIGTKPGFLREVNDNFESIIGNTLRCSDTEKISAIAKVVRKFYFGNDEINDGKINELVQFYGDILFVNNILEVADIQMQKELLTYLYKFSYRPDYPGMKDRFNVNIEGTCHGDELGCLFYAEMRMEKLKDGSRDRKTMERMTTMWANFAKTGNPTPETNELIPVSWKPLEKDCKNYLEISDDLISGENPDNQMWKMWKPLLESLK